MPNATEHTPVADEETVTVDGERESPAVEETPPDEGGAETVATATAGHEPPEVYTKVPAWAFRRPEDFPGGQHRHFVGRSRPTISARTDTPVPPPPAHASLGPAGRTRSPFGVALLSVITLGVYSIVWHRRVNTEMRDFDPGMHVRPGRSTIAVAIPWLVGTLVSIIGAARIVLAVLNVTLPFDPHFTVLQGYYLLAGILLVPYLEILLSFSAVALVMTLERVRLVEDRAGRTSDVQLKPVETVWWLIVPFTGGLILQYAIQRRLNGVWDLANPRPPARVSEY